MNCQGISTCRRNAFAIAAALRSQPYPASTVARPATLNRRAISESRAMRQMAAAIACGSFGGTARPFSSFRTSSVVPPTSVVTTGTPIAIASTNTMPSASVSLDKANTCADSSWRRMSASDMAPGSCTAWSTCSLAANDSRSRRNCPVAESASSPAMVSRASHPSVQLGNCLKQQIVPFARVKPATGEDAQRLPLHCRLIRRATAEGCQIDAHRGDVDGRQVRAEFPLDFFEQPSSDHDRKTGKPPFLPLVRAVINKRIV